MTPNEVQERLKLAQLKDKIWYVVPSCATTGEGLFEGLVRFTSLSLSLSFPVKKKTHFLSIKRTTNPPLMKLCYQSRAGSPITSRRNLNDKPNEPLHPLHSLSLPFDSTPNNIAYDFLLLLVCAMIPLYIMNLLAILPFSKLKEGWFWG